MFSGVYTAIVTPFKDGKLDEDSLIGLIEYQLHSGVDGLVPCGTTGESPTLDDAEYRRVVSLTVETVKGRVPVVAGAGSNSTDKALKLSKLAKDLGADATLQVAPYYNRPSQEGIYRHFAKLDEAGLPMMVYNIPLRCGGEHRAGHHGAPGRAPQCGRCEGGQRQPGPDDADKPPLRSEPEPAFGRRRPHPAAFGHRRPGSGQRAQQPDA